MSARAVYGGPGGCTALRWTVWKLTVSDHSNWIVAGTSAPARNATSTLFALAIGVPVTANAVCGAVCRKLLRLDNRYRVTSNDPADSSSGGRTSTPGAPEARPDSDSESCTL